MTHHVNKLSDGCNHPDLALRIFDLNYRKDLEKDITVIMDYIRIILTSNKGKLTSSEKRFIRIQMDLIDTLRLFPLRQLN